MKKNQGFTLLEILIALTIFLGLFALAVPNFRTAVQNNHIRSSADSLLSGVRLAKSEAMKNNSRIRFFLVSSLDNTCSLSSSGRYWIVSKDSPAGACDSAPSSAVAPRIIQKGQISDVSSNLVVNGSARSQLTFNGQGFVTTNPDSTFSLMDIAVSSGKLTTSEQTTYKVIVSNAGRIKMCRPSLPAGDPKSCS